MLFSMFINPPVFIGLPESIVLLLGPVHTNPDKFENLIFCFHWIGQPSTPKRRFRSTKAKLFENGRQSGEQSFCQKKKEKRKKSLV